MYACNKRKSSQSFFIKTQLLFTQESQSNQIVHENLTIQSLEGNALHGNEPALFKQADRNLAQVGDTLTAAKAGACT